MSDQNKDKEGEKIVSFEAKKVEQENERKLVLKIREILERYKKYIPDGVITEEDIGFLKKFLLSSAGVEDLDESFLVWFDRRILDMQKSILSESEISSLAKEDSKESRKVGIKVALLESAIEDFIKQLKKEIFIRKEHLSEIDEASEEDDKRKENTESGDVIEVDFGGGQKRL